VRKRKNGRTSAEGERKGTREEGGGRERRKHGEKGKRNE